jgi:hypothetical protein
LKSLCSEIEARSASDRNVATKHIQPELAQDLAELVKGKPDGMPVFGVPSQFSIANCVLRDDMARARDAWLESLGANQEGKGTPCKLG